MAELRPYLVAMASAKLELSLTTLGPHTTDAKAQNPEPELSRNPKTGSSL